MWRSLRRRILLTYTGTNFFFSVLITWAFVLSLNLATNEAMLTIVSIYALLFLVKQITFYTWFWRTLRPFRSFDLSALPDHEKGPKLEEALALLYHFPNAYASRVTAFWVIKYPVLGLILELFYSEQLDIGLNLWPATILVTLVSLFGCLAVSAPQMVLATEKVTSELSTLAFSHGIRPFQQRRLVFRKVLRYNIAIFAATTSWLLLLFFKAYDDADVQKNNRATEAVLQELLLDNPLNPLAPKTDLQSWMKNAEKSLERDSRLFLLGPDRQAVFGGPAVSWLMSQGQLIWIYNSLRTRSKGTLLIRREESFVAFREIRGSYCIGLIREHSPLVLSEVFLLFFVFGLVLFGFTITCSLFFSRSLSRPIGRLQKLCVDLQQNGQIDKANYLPVFEEDELGELVTDFNLLLRNLKELSIFARSIAEGRLEVEIVGEGDLQTSFRIMLVSLRETVQDISDGSNSVSRIGTSLLAASQAMNKASGKQAKTMDEVSVVMEELNKGIEHVSQSMDRIRRSADQNQMSAELSMQRIGQLSGQIDTVRELLQSIHKISKQSRMLALNASIEASRAGEAGASFGVVAQETRRLSDEIDHTAKEIALLLEKMDRAGTLTEVAAHENKEFAVSMAEMAQDISAVAWEQQQSASQITERVREASNSVAGTVSTSEESFEQAETLYGEAQKLTTVVARFNI
jgi:methyl-accepting chemotaxis protein